MKYRTLNKIKAHSPFEDGWKKLLTFLNKTKADNEEIDLLTVLESNGIKDAVWCLCTFDYIDRCLFMADVAELSLKNYEDMYGTDSRPRIAIESARKYHAKEISLEELRAADSAADSAARAAWLEIEKVFIKHFGEK